MTTITPQWTGASVGSWRVSPVVDRPTGTQFRRRRVAVIGGAVVLLLGLWLALQATLGGTGGGPLTASGVPGGLRPVVAQVWVVQPGDTLWSIARHSGVRGDIRPYVDRLSAEVAGQPLQVGQQILLPPTGARP